MSFRNLNIKTTEMIQTCTIKAKNIKNEASLFEYVKNSLCSLGSMYSNVRRPYKQFRNDSTIVNEHLNLPDH